jgi:hypothetical protein
VTDLRDLSLQDALTVVQGMRPLDRRCVQAAFGTVSDEVFAMDRFQAGGLSWTVVQDGEPVAIGGINTPTRWIGIVWFLATPSITRQSWRKLIRHGRTVLANLTNPQSPLYRHRLELHTLDEWQESHEFANFLGFRREGVRRFAGSGGEDIHVWTVCGPARAKEA